MRQARYLPMGLTVRLLKQIIKDWPEERPDGELTEVWIGKDGLSSQADSVLPLNLRDGAADIYLGNE